MAHQDIPADSPLWADHEPSHDAIGMRTFGFWLYMMSDSLIFAALFAAYAVLDHPMNAFGAPGPKQVVDPLDAFWQTLAILTSIFAFSLSTVAMKKRSREGTMLWMGIALVLGLVFLGLEVADFARLLAANAGPDRSGFLSAFYVLIATHGLHMVVGALWIVVMMIQVAMLGFTEEVVGRILCLRLFWQFQAAIWVCVYVFVYLRGAY